MKTRVDWTLDFFSKRSTSGVEIRRSLRAKKKHNVSTGSLTPHAGAKKWRKNGRRTVTGLLLN